ncbi:hypothetical protein CC1G_15230 [Coprinopsis cinerea okayama7|uniref:Uncharacterized protein n=1 Tax=Coprinopsis cinerea (strain Okayama-7 / 130 / ATCC MYA-4618 / FGSC 9003) TaxID=240176 RepID=D6RPU7_COPC7|nr:hypothetical protein CC1G_15230 [Coprinopsis cinerea okayama7\|eukprot:XP_002910594.1 hypothetical protein CC1G_15230 [Coprinopsis cinerea okayama7\
MTTKRDRFYKSSKGHFQDSTISTNRRGGIDGAPGWHSSCTAQTTMTEVAGRHGSAHAGIGNGERLQGL